MRPHNTQSIQYIACIDTITQAQPKARAEKSALARTKKGMVMMRCAPSSSETHDDHPVLDPITL
jgi:hypothetical protein